MMYRALGALLLGCVAAQIPLHHQTLQANAAAASTMLRAYAKMHHKVAMHLQSTGELAPGMRMTIVAVRDQTNNRINAEDTGVADRFTGLISIFACALASNTAFFVDWPGLDEYYQTGTGNMDWNFHRSDGYYKKLPKAANSIYPFQPWTDGSALNVMNIMSSQKISFMHSGHGDLHVLWPHWQKEYPRMHVLKNAYKETEIFRALFKFLFAPSQKMTTAFSALQHRLTNSHKKKVMLQIRIGDDIIKQENGTPLVGKAAADTLAKADEFLKCADNIFGKEDVLWYLMTDSETVKHRTLQKYGAKNLVLNQGGRATMHTSYIKLKTAAQDPMLAVMGEQWLGTFCDEFIISHDSGLGRQAAFLAHHIPEYLYYGGRTRSTLTYGYSRFFKDKELYGRKCYKDTILKAMPGWSAI